MLIFYYPKFYSLLILIDSRAKLWFIQNDLIFETDIFLFNILDISAFTCHLVSFIEWIWKGASESRFLLHLSLLETSHTSALQLPEQSSVKRVQKCFHFLCYFCILAHKAHRQASLFWLSWHSLVEEWNFKSTS